MMKDDLHMDKLFRDKLKNYSEEPPAFVWDHVQSVLAGKHRQKKIGWYRILAIAAMLILAFIGGWYLSTPDEGSIVLHEIPEAISPEAGEDLPVIDDRDDRDRLIAQAVDSVSDRYVGSSVENGSQHQIRLEKTLVADASSATLREVPSEISLLKSLTASVSAEESFREPDGHRDMLISQLQMFPDQWKSDLPDGVFDAGVIASAQTDQPVVEKSNNRWRIGVNLSTGYASYRASYAATYSRNMVSDLSVGHGTLNGGLAIQYKTRNRLRLESGLYYARNGLHTGSAPQIAGKMADAINMPLSVEELYFNTAVDIPGNRMAINGAAGVIEVESIPHGVEVAATPESRVSYTSALIAPGELTQVFDFIEIPLYLRYLLLESPINMELVGGFNTGLIVGNHAYIDTEFGAQSIGKTEDISTFNINASLGLGFNYPLGKFLSFAIEPRINYSLNSLNRNPEVNFRPYRAGLYTGLYYNF